ncbi:MAG: hypothetical protein DSZ33_05330 [Gammaproteobacteria bacterium]|nr:MAG: hypothetical protein DSZ33_05330 [Gammaproteobacteria bacterium]
MFIAASPEAFRSLFSEKLEFMLATGGLGAFILVLANSMQDARLRDRLATPLRLAFEKLQSHAPGAAPDDALVFDSLRKTGLDPLGVWETRKLDNWRLNLNPLRALRPARAAGKAFTCLHKPFDEQAFHFDKPFLEPEVLWRGHIEQDLSLKVLYNKFPFAPFHLLIAPEPASHLPQFLAVEHHTAMWDLLEQNADQFSDLRLAYNSIGAGASVNHLHFQGFVDEPLPVEDAHWSHNGGESAYPLPCRFHQNICHAWKAISRYQKTNQPFNVLYVPGGCYILKRKPAGDKSLPSWGRGAAWAEACGLFTLPDRKTYESLGDSDICAALSSLADG